MKTFKQYIAEGPEEVEEGRIGSAIAGLAMLGATAAALPGNEEGYKKHVADMKAKQAVTKKVDAPKKHKLKVIKYNR